MAGRVTGQYAGLLVTNLEKDIPDPEACVREVKDMLDIAMADDGYTPPAEYVVDLSVRRDELIGKGLVVQ